MENVMKIFDQLHESYESLIKNSEAIFLALKLKDFPGLKILNIRQVSESERLVTRLEQLGTDIGSLCQYYGEAESKISSILPHVSMARREALLKHQETAFNAERKFKHNVQINQMLAEAMMACSQTIVDTWVHVAQAENKSNSFVNRKL